MEGSAGSHTGSHATRWLSHRLTHCCFLIYLWSTDLHATRWLTHRLTHYLLAHTQAHTLPSGSHAGSHTGSHTVGFVYISGLPAQGIVWLTVAWAFLLQLMIKTLSQRCTLGQIWSGQSLTETPFSSDCVELTVGDYAIVSQDEQLRKDFKSHRREARLSEMKKK